MASAKRAFLWDFVEHAVASYGVIEDIGRLIYDIAKRIIDDSLVQILAQLLPQHPQREALLDALHDVVGGYYLDQFYVVLSQSF